ncbi:archaeosortase A [Methanocella sp. MCL-LM]|uniref:archaeosortase A n=1 Tax=Methanocella sp. MCL-LM TaxID=3412035 RepID=UPI003C7314F3
MQLFGMDALDVLMWISFLIIVLGAIIPKKNGYYIAAVGWVLFGLRWGLSTPYFYFEEANILYTVLCLLSVPLTLYAAFIMIKFQRESLMVITRSVAISCVFYAPFAFLPWLSNWLIGVTTSLTMASLTALGYPAVRQGLDLIYLNGQVVQIILACTAIQSIAIFIGVVFCMKVEPERMLKAFLVSVPVIYILNLIRDVFVVASFGNQWFQIMPETVMQWSGKPAEFTSFFWAHNVLAELGSLIALVVISYAVLSMMPELLDYLRDVLSLLKAENIKKMLRGENVPVLAPVKPIKKA